jgi:tripartite-type tricarboxylate transporter receptor subunit TctC
MMNRITRCALVVCMWIATQLAAHVWAADFYKGKTIRFTAGLAPGGGDDTYLRLATESGQTGSFAPNGPVRVSGCAG